MATDDRGLDQFDAATPADEAEEHLTNDMFTEENDPSATDVSAAADSPDTPETPDSPPTAETPQDVPNEEAEVSEELSDEELFLAAVSGDIGSSEGDDDFLIISNSYGGFPEMLQRLVNAVPHGTVTEETEQLLKQPPLRQADVFTAWFAVIALGYILIAQFKS